MKIWVKVGLIRGRTNQLPLPRHGPSPRRRNKPDLPTSYTLRQRISAMSASGKIVEIVTSTFSVLPAQQLRRDLLQAHGFFTYRNKRRQRCPGEARSFSAGRFEADDGRIRGLPGRLILAGGFT